MSQNSSYYSVHLSVAYCFYLKEPPNCILCIICVGTSISLSTHLYKTAFSTYSFCKTRFLLFYVLVFHVSTYLVFIFNFFSVLCFEFNVTYKDLITFFNFDLTLFKQSVNIRIALQKKHAFRGLLKCHF